MIRIELSETLGIENNYKEIAVKILDRYLNDGTTKYLYIFIESIDDDKIYTIRINRNCEYVYYLIFDEDWNTAKEDIGDMGISYIANKLKELVKWILNDIKENS